MFPPSPSPSAPDMMVRNDLLYVHQSQRVNPINLYDILMVGEIIQISQQSKNRTPTGSDWGEDGSDDWCNVDLNKVMDGYEGWGGVTKFGNAINNNKSDVF